MPPKTYYVSLGVCRIPFSFSWAGLAKMASSWSVSIQCCWSSVSPPHLCCSYQACQDEISVRPPGPRLEHDRKEVCVRVAAVPIALKHKLRTRALQPDSSLLVRLPFVFYIKVCSRRGLCWAALATYGTLSCDDKNGRCRGELGR